MLKVIRTIITAILVPMAGIANAQIFQPSENIVKLPVNGLLAIEKNGKFALLTDTGRFIIEGKMYDIWAQQEISTLEDARHAASHIPVDKTETGFSDLEPLTIGKGKNVITMFADPACKFCKEIMQEARNYLPQGYQLDVIMLSLLSPQSVKRNVELLCAKDKTAAWQAAVEGDMKTPLEQIPKDDCPIDVIAKRHATAHFFGVRSVPYLVRDDGLTREGKPAEGLRAWIENTRRSN